MVLCRDRSVRLTSDPNRVYPGDVPALPLSGCSDSGVGIAGCSDCPFGMIDTGVIYPPIWFVDFKDVTILKASNMSSSGRYVVFMGDEHKCDSLLMQLIE